MNNLPKLIISKIDFYLWKHDIKKVNKEYKTKLTGINSLRSVILGTISMKLDLNKPYVKKFNYRNLKPFSFKRIGYYYEKPIIHPIEKRTKRNITRINLPPRYYFSMDPPEYVLKRCESQKPKKFYVKKN